MVDETMTDGKGDSKAALVERLLGFATLLQGLSDRFLGTARALTLSGALLAVLLDLLLKRSFDWSLGVSLGVGFLLLLPAGVVGWGWYVLSEAVNLPGRLRSWLGSAKSTASAFADRARQTAPRRGTFSDLWSLGGLAVDLTSMGLDASGLMAILGGSLSVTNPIYLLALVVSIGLIGLFGGAVLILGLIALF